ncbi:alpha/beta hydrolase [Leptolyngbya sp. FACHB-321]|uniref:alpha/beta fold hydrolase n=1 Tax=Leptolyngbya sp. FACHB-321 TaxID=2692807 RepID=UPI001688AD2C|nr:alpha/beta hydrolase [Leptolyngbya sp. FACHB-321]MBD2037834.1 alpha/beta hydrolase [Leptolyngbya sp. FACHB-321]
MQTIAILGAPHAYDLTAPTASKATLVFIHGWLLSRSYWQPLIEQLSPDYQCLSYDLRGFGGSQPCPETPLAQVVAGYGLTDYANDLALLLEQLQLENVWLVGHSVGGSIALCAAEQLPQQVKGVICLNSGGGVYLKAEFDRFRAAGQQLVKLRPRWLGQVPWLDLLFTRASVVQTIARRWGRQRLLDFVAAQPEAALGLLLDSTTEAEVHRLPQVVARLKQPVYFIAGAQDPIMEPQYVRHLASFHPLFKGCGANVAEIANCGHMAMLEQPTAVVAQLRAILAQYDASGVAR